MTLLDRFSKSVELNPDALAVAFHNERMSYKSLYQLSSRVRSYLVSQQLTKGDRVAILVQNSPEYIAIYYGALAAGAIVVSLNTQAKARDINNWIFHSGARWLFAESQHKEIPKLDKQITKNTQIVLVGDTDISNKWREIVLISDLEWPDISIKSDDLASIIYTSGTTGNPKGVTLSHGNLDANTESIINYLKLTPNDSIMNVLPFYYSYGNSVMHTHLASGGSLILENSLTYPHLVMQKLANEQATGFSGVPSTFALLLGRVKLNDYDLSKLRYVTQAGGPIAPSLVNRFRSTLPHVDFIIMYGQTEASARLTYLPSEMLERKTGSIGVPIPGVKIEVRNKENKKVDAGIVGEICATGKNIMRGYWHDLEQTEKIIKNGWLHTGDLAHMDSEGYLYIDGRSSDMIKVGGNRISPKEVEEVIQELKEIQEVAVVGITDETLGETIKAFIVVNPKMNLDKSKVQRHCKMNLATYKIPKKINFVDELPKTASGKIQKFILMQDKS